MAAGMNWGIFSLLGIVVLVLGGIAGFFIYLARRAAALQATAPPAAPGICPGPKRHRAVSTASLPARAAGTGWRHPDRAGRPGRSLASNG